jgi:NAD(P)-dependent dehydrogenase (short-subunit alcohol dehydrogenase family)
MPPTPSYTTSKGALIAMTKALAVEWAKNGITVNAISPGFFESPLTYGTIKHLVRTNKHHHFGDGVRARAI